METPQEQQSLQVIETAAAQDLALVPSEVKAGMTPSPRAERQLMLPEQATPEEVADAMDGVLGKPDPEPAPQERFNAYRDGSFEKQAAEVDQPKHSSSLIRYIGRQAVRVFTR